MRYSWFGEVWGCTHKEDQDDNNDTLDEEEPVERQRPRGAEGSYCDIEEVVRHAWWTEWKVSS
jgi:hypothetical protein